MCVCVWSPYWHGSLGQGKQLTAAALLKDLALANLRAKKTCCREKASQNIHGLVQERHVPSCTLSAECCARAHMYSFKMDLHLRLLLPGSKAPVRLAAWFMVRFSHRVISLLASTFNLARAHRWLLRVLPHNPGTSGGGGEYAIQTGFGWTNGAMLDFLNRFGWQPEQPSVPAAAPAASA